MSSYFPDPTHRRGMPAVSQNLGLGACLVPGARSMRLQILKEAMTQVKSDHYDPHGLIWALALRRTFGIGGLRIMGEANEVAIILRTQAFWRGTSVSAGELRERFGYTTLKIHPLAPESELTGRPEFSQIKLDQGVIASLSRKIKLALEQSITEDQQQRKTG